MKDYDKVKLYYEDKVLTAIASFDEATRATRFYRLTEFSFEEVCELHKTQQTN